tara:strand:+ start:218 stop:592 length:375 start_codon:yes stop_codon:yes gene_type:complete
MNEVKYCFVIDPHKEEIRVVDLPGDTLELSTIYDLLDCTRFDVHSLTADTDLFFDDEGLLVEKQRFFVTNNKVFAGNGLIVGGVNEKGHSTTPTYLDDFLPVKWLPKNYYMEITQEDLEVKFMD